MIKYLLTWVAIASVAGCVVRPDLVSAHIKNSGDKIKLVEVVLLASDAKKIRDREIYFSIVVLDCENYENRFPIEPHIAGRLASHFDFPIAGEFVTVQGSVPEKILTTFPTPCVALQGGSYVFGKLNSMPVPLVRLGK